VPGISSCVGGCVTAGVLGGGFAAGGGLTGLFGWHSSTFLAGTSNCSKTQAEKRRRKRKHLGYNLYAFEQRQHNHETVSCNIHDGSS